MSMFEDFLSVLDEGDFDEIPVGLDEFIAGEKYMNKGNDITLSLTQRDCILKSTQIYKLETLKAYMPEEEAEIRWEDTKNEVILQLGKGSGKDFMSSLSCCYVVYLLLCLKDPSKYYGFARGGRIDILNIAVNATQAQNVFFTELSGMITSSPWFQGKYEAKPGGDPANQGRFNFSKNVNVYSGHSEREAWEGYNLFMVILDEISGFALESASPTGKTAEAIYKMYRGSVVSRFPDFGKYISLSFPRYKNDFIQQRYDKVIASKQTVIRQEIMKINDKLPEGFEGNEIMIEWEEDHIDAYRAPNVFALKRPPWDVNPIKTLRNYVSEFVDDYTDALGRFGCMPPDAVDAFFKDREKIERAFAFDNGVDNADGTFTMNFEPDPDKEYYVHVDLAQKHDRCAVSMAHVQKWVKRDAIAGREFEPAPVIKVDAIRYWQPTKQKEVDFTEVQDYIVSLSKKGFNVKLVTFDQWRSEDMRKYLNSVGIKSELLSVKKEQYIDMAVIMNENRLEGPMEPLIIEELLQLRLYSNGKIDHTRKGYKDLSDATCGAIFNAINRTRRSHTTEIEVKTASDYRQPVRNSIPVDNVIVAPKRQRMPEGMAAYLERIGPRVI